MNNLYRILLFPLLMSCSASPDYTNPPGYDLSSPEENFMKENLLEISGIAFRDHKADTVWCINDEEGRVYLVPVQKGPSGHVRFAKDGDYEDISVGKNAVYVLHSNGRIFSFPLDSAKNDRDVNAKVNHVLPKGEYEGMYADTNSGKLFVLCKSCGDKKNGIEGKIITISGDSLSLSGDFRVDLPEQQGDKGKKKNVLPSAIAQHALTHDWYIISSQNKTLWITDSNWKHKQSYRLDPKIFIQPEGIAFDDQHNLYISNEGSEIHNGNILKFIFHPN